MDKTTHCVRQVAFQIDVDDLAELDALASAESRSRAALIRLAVREWLAGRRHAAIDASLARAYEGLPPTGEEGAWADLSVEGLEAGGLDW